MRGRIAANAIGCGHAVDFRVDRHERFDLLRVRAGADFRWAEQTYAIDFADFHARQLHVGAFAQTVRVGKARAQVQMALEGIEFARRVQDKENKDGERDEDEQANPQLAQSDVPG